MGTAAFELGCFTPQEPQRRLDGYLAASIVYTDPLSSEKIRLVGEYLAAKYGVSGYSGALYVGDDAGNGNFDWGVAGIGRESDGSNSSAYSAGLHIVDQGFLADNGDYLIAGYDDATTNVTVSDCPTGVDRRWVRTWYLDKTDAGSNGGNVDIVFDFGEFGVPVTPSATASNYVLLTRAGTSGAFSEAATAVSVSGDQVTFTVNAATLTDGNKYTLGAKNGATLPVGVSSFLAD